MIKILFLIELSCFDALRLNKLNPDEANMEMGLDDDAELFDLGEGGTTVPVETLIVSVGGSGTTTFMHEIAGVTPSLHINSFGDKDQMKHRPFTRQGPRLKPTLKKILYLHGDLTHAVMSLNRRGWLFVQAKKVHSNWTNGEKPYHGMTLSKYANTAGDSFYQMAEHFHSFKNQCKYPVAFLDITRKTKHLPELAQFLGASEQQLREHLRPWEFSVEVENSMLKQKDYSKYSEEEYIQELLQFEKTFADPDKGLILSEDPSHHYDNIDKSIFEKFDQKFANIKQEMQAMGGLYIQKATCA